MRGGTSPQLRILMKQGFQEKKDLLKVDETFLILNKTNRSFVLIETMAIMYVGYILTKICDLMV